MRGAETANAEQSQLAIRPAMPAHQTTKFAYIDALRGYAVLLVITCHAGEMFAELPYPLRKLTNFGWHGVQLFFLLSCVTLLLSWRADEAKDRASVTGFWTRRLFRIAPMYYLAALFYFVIETPPSGFDLGQFLASFTFMNAWHPTLIPTVPDRWMVVPGGWSIGVEVTFYLMFPMMVMLINVMRGAIVFFVVTLAIGCIANPLMDDVLRDNYSAVAIGNFLYFWFPNQLPVFALGAVLYFVLQSLQAKPEHAIAILLRRYSTMIILACVAAGVGVANLPLPAALPFASPLGVPAYLVASLIFMIVVAVLAGDPRSPFINRPICLLGQVSFSAYLLHFAVLRKLPQLLPDVFDVDATGWQAIAAWFALWLAVIPVTYALSLIAFRTVENPMIQMGRRLLTPQLGRNTLPGTRQSSLVKGSRAPGAA